MSRLIPFAAAFLVSAALAQDIAVPQPTTAYSAKQTIRMGDFSLTADIAYEDGKHRTEMNMMGQKMYTIVRRDLGLVWSGMPGGMYIETEFGEESGMPGQQNRMPSLAEIRNAVVFENEGPESIEGTETTRYHYVVDDPNGGRVDGRAWLTDENIPIQLVMTGEMNGQQGEIRMLLHDLEIGDQPDELFELPAGAKKFSFGGIPGLGGRGPFGGGNR